MSENFTWTQLPNFIHALFVGFNHFRVILLLWKFVLRCHLDDALYRSFASFDQVKSFGFFILIIHYFARVKSLVLKFGVKLKYSIEGQLIEELTLHKELLAI